MATTIRVLFTVVLLPLVITPAFSAPEDTTITVCRIELTKAGQGANFRFSYGYLILTNKAGFVEKVTKLSERPKFVVEENLVDCIRTWKLQPSSKYVVRFSVGTNAGRPNYISIAEPKGKSMKLILPEDSGRILDSRK